MIYLKLLFAFFKIGLFSFGGGYAMIPLIQKEIEINGWLGASEFVDIIAIPGPVAINTATFVGYKVAGLFGSMVSTIGVSLPSVILILLISGIFFKLQRNPVNNMVFYGIRPVITGLIAAATFFVAETAIVKTGISTKAIKLIFNDPSAFFDYGGIAILIASLIALIKYKVHPIVTIAGAGVAGFFVYYMIPQFLA